MGTVKEYIYAGVDRVILGTAAVTDTEFLKAAIAQYGSKIAVGVDLKDGYVAIKGWTEVSEKSADQFFGEMSELGVDCIICTDISKDGAMQGTNRMLYKQLSESFKVKLVASGGVSSIEDVKALAEMNVYGAIIGKAYYTGAIDLKEAIEVAK
jgi:phosphoribosylformimino-5-aminoimidazole carboxamide ribotide isomerase